MASVEELSKYYWGALDSNDLTEFIAIKPNEEEIANDLNAPPQPVKSQGALVINGYYFKGDGSLVYHEMSCGYMVSKGTWKLNDNTIEMVIEGVDIVKKITYFEAGNKLILSNVK